MFGEIKYCNIILLQLAGRDEKWRDLLLPSTGDAGKIPYYLHRYLMTRLSLNVFYL
jgi:hypothetical protein